MLDTPFESHSPMPRCRGGFTLVELLVVIGIIALLIAILLPTLNQARAKAVGLSCASNLRELGRAAMFYQQDNKGFVPRDHTPWRDDRNPNWLYLLSTYIDETNDQSDTDTTGDVDDTADQDPGRISNTVLRETDALQCPAHPLVNQIPGGYVVNAFAFERAPDEWDPDGPVKLVKVQDTSNVIFVAEAADYFGESNGDAFADNYVFLQRFHDLYSPEHLPRRGGERISDDRHKGRANLLWFDTSVRTVKRGGIELEWFDDKVTQRAVNGIYGDDADDGDDGADA